MPDALMLVIDSSDEMRNGDYFPSRFEAALETATAQLRSCLRSNPENAVGLLRAGGKNDVLVTLTAEEGKLLTGLHKMRMGGDSRVSSAVQIAALALRHRQNKMQKQRMLVIVGSPVAEREAAELLRVAPALKKNNIVADVVSLGAHDGNNAALSAFVEAVGGDGKFVAVPPETRSVRDAVRSALADPDAPQNASAAMDIDETEDPELLAAIQASLAEAGNDASLPTPQGMSTPAPNSADDIMMDLDPDMDPELLEAIRLSMLEANMTENEEKKDGDGSEKKAGDGSEKKEEDGTSVDDVLLSLPGVDLSAEELQELKKEIKKSNK